MVLLIFFVLTLSLFTSCEDTDTSISGTQVNPEITSSSNTTDLSIFDIDHNIELSFLRDGGINLTNVDITTNEGTFPSTTNSNTAVFSSSIFGTLEAEKEKVFEATVSSSEATTFTTNFSVAVNKVINSPKTPETIIYKNNKPDTLIIETKTTSATVDEVLAYWKVNSSGTFQLDNNLDNLNIDSDMVTFNNLDETTNGYNLRIKDTLYYRFIAKSGALTDTLNVQLPISHKNFDAFFENLSLSNNTTGINLENDDSSGNEILYDFSSKILSNNTGVSISFVQITDLSSTIYDSASDLFDANDLTTAKDLFDNGSGSATMSFMVNDINQLVAYKIDRSGVISYGLILFTEFFNIETNTGLEEGVKFSYRENKEME